MAVSVRMGPVLEQALEHAAKQQGVSKSQFIIDAVERALGRRDPFALLQQVNQQYGLDKLPPPSAPDTPAAGNGSLRERLRDKLQTKHDAEMRDWLAYHEARRRGQTWQPDDEAGAP